VIDIHNYFGPWKNEAQVSYQVRAGDKYANRPAVLRPDRAPAACEQVRGHPSFISEFTWVNPADYAAEGPLLTASIAGMNDIDGFTWFANHNLSWANSVEKWPVASPTLMAQSPGCALLYRRGDNRLADVLVSEGRSLEAMFHREKSIITQGNGFDPTRNGGTPRDAKAGAGRVDPLAMVLGKVEVRFDNDADKVDPRLESLVDRANGLHRSVTGQLRFDTTGGLFTHDTPRSQGAAGFLDRAGPIRLGQTEIRMQNDFGAALVISLDGRPLAETAAILVQAATNDKPHKWKATPATLKDGTPGMQIKDLGQPPLNVTEIRGTVLIKGITAADRPEVHVLDPNGMTRSVPVHRITPGGLEITLPKNAFYTFIALRRPPEVE